MAKRFSVFQKLIRFLQLQSLRNNKGAATENVCTFKKLFSGLFAGSLSPEFIPSVLGEPAGFLMDQHQLRTRRMEAALLSILVHASIILLAILLVHKSNRLLPVNENMVIINTPFFGLPNEDEGAPGRGGGGGGKEEQAPPAWGGLPNTTRMQLLPPDPKEPQPLIPLDENTAINGSVEMPMEMARDLSVPIGDPIAPFNNSRSSGPGHSGGIGGGDGPGIDDGTGAGFGLGEKRGMGGSKFGTVGSHGNGVYTPGTAGLTNPEILFDPKPEYTESARKSRIEGTVMLQVIIRKDGSVDGIRILRGLGYGLDDSAIRTISAKWRFSPGRLNGCPVDVPIKIEVSFHLF
jgi:TonB family protein